MKSYGSNSIQSSLMVGFQGGPRGGYMVRRTSV